MGCIVIHRIHDSEHGNGGESGQNPVGRIPVRQRQLLGQQDNLVCEGRLPKMCGGLGVPIRQVEQQRFPGRDGRESKFVLGLFHFFSNAATERSLKAHSQRFVSSSSFNRGGRPSSPFCPVRVAE